MSSKVKSEKSKSTSSAHDTTEYDEWAKKLVARTVPSTTNQNAGPQHIVFQAVNPGGNGLGAGAQTMFVGADGLPPHQG